MAELKRGKPTITILESTATIVVGNQKCCKSQEKRKQRVLVNATHWLIGFCKGHDESSDHSVKSTLMDQLVGTDIWEEVEMDIYKFLPWLNLYPTVSLLLSHSLTFYFIKYG